MNQTLLLIPLLLVSSIRHAARLDAIRTLLSLGRTKGNSSPAKVAPARSRPARSDSILKATIELVETGGSGENGDTKWNAETKHPLIGND
jgi:hypothetical protein